MGLYRMGELTSLVALCELGDVRRLSASRKAVRMAGIDLGGLSDVLCEVGVTDFGPWGRERPP